MSRWCLASTGRGVAVCRCAVMSANGGANRGTSLEALGISAAAFIRADAIAMPATGQAPSNARDPIAAANAALQQNRRMEDLDGDKVIRNQ